KLGTRHSWFFKDMRSSEIRALKILLPRFHRDQIISLIDKLVDFKEMVHPSPTRRTFFGALARHLDSELQCYILEKILERHGSSLEFPSVLKGMTPFLRPQTIERAIELIGNFKFNELYEYYRILAPVLTRSQLAQAFDKINSPRKT